MEDYTLYVANDCHDCDEVLKFIKEKGRPITILNYDIDEPNHSEVLFVFPVLFKGPNIIAYGVDIKEYI